MQTDGIGSAGETPSSDLSFLYPRVRDRVAALRDGGFDEKLEDVLREHPRGDAADETVARILLAAAQTVNDCGQRINEIQKRLATSVPSCAPMLAELDEAHAAACRLRSELEARYGIDDLWMDF